MSDLVDRSIQRVRTQTHLQLLEAAVLIICQLIRKVHAKRRVVALPVDGVRKRQVLQPHGCAGQCRRWRRVGSAASAVLLEGVEEGLKPRPRHVLVWINRIERLLVRGFSSGSTMPMRQPQSTYVEPRGQRGEVREVAVGAGEGKQVTGPSDAAAVQVLVDP